MTSLRLIEQNFSASQAVLARSNGARIAKIERGGGGGGGGGPASPNFTVPVTITSPASQLSVTSAGSDNAYLKLENAAGVGTADAATLFYSAGSYVGQVGYRGVLNALLFASSKPGSYFHFSGPNMDASTFPTAAPHQFFVAGAGFANGQNVSSGGAFDRISSSSANVSGTFYDSYHATAAFDDRGSYHCFVANYQLEEIHTFRISGIADSGLGAPNGVKITTTRAHGRTTGDRVYLKDTVGGPGGNVNGNWTVTVLNTTSYTLNGTTWSGSAGYTGTSMTSIAASPAGVVNSGTGPVKIVTDTPHGMTTGDSAYIEGTTGGPGGINNGIHAVTVLNTTSFTVDGTTFGASSPGGGGGTFRGAYHEGAGFQTNIQQSSLGGLAQGAEWLLTVNKIGRTIGQGIGIVERFPYINYGNPNIIPSDYRRTGSVGLKISAQKVAGAGTVQVGTGILLSEESLTTTFQRHFVIHDSSGVDRFCIARNAHPTLNDSIGIGIGTTAIVDQFTNQSGLTAALVISPHDATPVIKEAGIQFGTTGAAWIYRSGTNALTIDGSLTCTGGVSGVTMSNPAYVSATAASQFVTAVFREWDSGSSTVFPAWQIGKSDFPTASGTTTSGDFVLYNTPSSADIFRVYGADNLGTSLAARQGTMVMKQPLHLLAANNRYPALRGDFPANLSPVAISSIAAGAGTSTDITFASAHNLDGNDINIYGTTVAALNKRWNNGQYSVTSSTVINVLTASFTAGSGGYAQRRDLSKLYLLLSGRNTNMVNAGRSPSNVDEDSLTSTGQATAGGTGVNALNFSATSARSFTGRGSFVLTSGSLTMDEAAIPNPAGSEGTTAFDTYGEAGYCSMLVTNNRRGGLANNCEFNVFTKARVGATTTTSGTNSAGGTTLTVASTAALGAVGAFSSPTGTLVTCRLNGTTGARTYLSHTYDQTGNGSPGTTFTNLSPAIPTGGYASGVLVWQSTGSGGPGRVHVTLNQVWEANPYSEYATNRQGQWAFAAADHWSDWGAVGFRVRNSGSETAGTGILIEGGESVTTSGNEGRPFMRGVVLHLPASNEDVLTLTHRGNMGFGPLAAINQGNASLSARIVLPTPGTAKTRGTTASGATTLNVGVLNGAWPTAGTVTLPTLTTAISGATNATPIVITATAHGRTTNDQVVISGVGGNTAANGTWTITVTGANTFSLNSSVGNGAYTSGGTVLPAFSYTGTSGNSFTGVTGVLTAIASGTTISLATGTIVANNADGIIFGTDASPTSFFRSHTSTANQALRCAALGVGVTVPTAAFTTTAGKGFWLGDGLFQVARSTTATQTVIGVHRTDNTTATFVVQQDGKLTWANFAASNPAADTNLYRGGADALQTDDSFRIGGSLAIAPKTTIAATYALTSGDTFVRADTDNGSTAITMPAISTVSPGQVVHIVNVGVSSISVTINRTGSDTFEGGATSVSVPGVTGDSSVTLWADPTSARWRKFGT